MGGDLIVEHRAFPLRPTPAENVPFKGTYREAGFAREAVVADYEAAVSEHGVRAIPTVIVPETGRALVGLADLAVYRAAIEEAAG